MSRFANMVTSDPIILLVLKEFLFICVNSMSKRMKCYKTVLDLGCDVWLSENNDKGVLYRVVEGILGAFNAMTPDQRVKQIFSEGFGTERLTENYTRLGTWINLQLHLDWIQYQAAQPEQEATSTLGPVNWDVVYPKRSNIISIQ